MAPPAIQFELSNPPTDAVSSLKFAPESSTRLLVSSWDKHVYLYETHDGDGEGGKLIEKFEHRAPVLDVCFGANDNEAFTAGMDWQVKRLNLETGEQTVLSVHEAPVKAVVYSKAHSLLVSASWDCTLHFHDLAHPEKEPVTIVIPHKPHSLSITASKLVVAMASRLLYIYELRSTMMLASQATSATEIKPWQTRESSLKFMTRAVACMQNDDGYASSSIEGRVAVEWFDPSPESQARKYAFKCHRQPAPENDGTDIVYPVNALAFHPIHGSFASGGGDGVVALWDAVAKRRIRQYQKYDLSIAALAFSNNGKYLAVGVCPGFENGQEDYSGEGATKVYIRELSETEAKGKGPK